MDTLFLVFSKAAWLFLRPETGLVLLFVLPWVLLQRGYRVAASRMLAFALMIILAIGLFPLGNLALDPLERTYPANPDMATAGGIIVLGGMEDIAPKYAGRIAQVNDASERLISAFALAQRFPDAPVLYSGGRLALTPVEEGTFEVGPDVLGQLGLPESRLIVEGRSRTTYENAIFSKAVVEKIEGREESDTHSWVLVTSAWHMPRALGTFCAAGWTNVVPYPVDYRGGNFWNETRWDLAVHLMELNVGIKEWIGLFAYKLSGRMDDYFPKKCE